ncbi:DUF1819 family protein [Enterococcus sp. CWB-B31]|uniref:DUF1819 family protein n=1 Tax=Enterococcus sp. CWB-B31 TaxID=2885159 RepID=UPI001E285478|nr:DUF1819 family protein [Enterococcus sp. CWB-B31]MCB5955579.1 DUF1819 family protein [Enterococcus sp. CWB-B31]
MEKEYSAGMASHSTWFNEFREYIHLRNSGADDDDIRDMVEQENIFNASSIARGKRMYGVLKRRVNILGEEILPLFFYLDVFNQQVVNVVAIMLEQRIFQEFMIEVYAEKLLTGQLDLNQKDYREFWQKKMASTEKTNKWTEQTIKRLSRSFRQVLIDSQFIKENGNKDIIVRPVVDFRLQDWFTYSKLNMILFAVTGGN